MRSYRFIHAADLHLDSPFRGMVEDAPQFASTLRDATFDTYEAIIELCIAERADALLVAGDIYDGADRSLRAQLRFIEGLRRLDEAGIRAFICHGNHDPLDGWEAQLTFPGNVVQFGPSVSAEPVNTSDPGSPLVYGMSYPTREVRENLVPLFPQPEPGRFCIGLLHANVGANTGHEPYAPCSLADLEQSGMDYWALGHVHTRAVLRDRHPTVVYPGNPQGRHVNEAGARGVYVVDVDGQGAPRLEFRAVDRVRWERVSLAIDELENEQDLLDAAERRLLETRDDAGGRPLVYRLRLDGRGALHASLSRDGFLRDVQDQLNDRLANGNAFAFCERIDDETSPDVDREELRASQDLLGDIVRMADDLVEDEEALEELRGELRVLFEHQRARRYLSDRAVDQDDVRAFLREAERLLVDELYDAGGR